MWRKFIETFFREDIGEILIGTFEDIIEVVYYFLLQSLTGNGHGFCLKNVDLFIEFVDLGYIVFGEVNHVAD
jgi:hypothetical protein